jgi:hypothetical protein
MYSLDAQGLSRAVNDSVQRLHGHAQLAPSQCATPSTSHSPHSSWFLARERTCVHSAAAVQVSPFAYSIRALIINEFVSPRWQNLPSARPGVTLGDASLAQLDFYTERCGASSAASPRCHSTMRQGSSADGAFAVNAALSIASLNDSATLALRWQGACLDHVRAPVTGSGSGSASRSTCSRSVCSRRSLPSSSSCSARPRTRRSCAPRRRSPRASSARLPPGGLRFCSGLQIRLVVCCCYASTELSREIERKIKCVDCRSARKAREDAQKALQGNARASKLTGSTGKLKVADTAVANTAVSTDANGAATSTASGRTLSGTQNQLAVGSQLHFTPIAVVWQDLSYYVAVAKGLTGATALNIMESDVEPELAGKKRLLNSITGAARGTPRLQAQLAACSPMVGCSQ